MNHQTQQPIIILRRRELEQRLGLARSTIYDKINPSSSRYDASFPKPIKLGSAAVGWVASEVDQWLSLQIIASRNGAS